MMKRYFLVFVVLSGLLASCSLEEPLPMANPPHLIKDSFYYCRDTLNFHYVKVDPIIVESVDSIIAIEEIRDNYHWVLVIDKENRNEYSVKFYPIYSERFMLLLDDTEQPYKATLIQDRIVFIYDEDGLLDVDLNQPKLKVFNPQLMIEYYPRLSEKWRFIFNKKGSIKYLGKW